MSDNTIPDEMEVEQMAFANSSPTYPDASSPFNGPVEEATPLWVDVPMLSEEERAKYQYFEPTVNDEEPVEVVYEIKSKGERYYFAKMRSGLYKKFPETFFTENDGDYAELLDVYQDAKDNGTLPEFDPSSRKVIPADRMAPQPNGRGTKSQPQPKTRASTRQKGRAVSDSPTGFTEDSPSSFSENEGEDEDDVEFDEPFSVRRSARNVGKKDPFPFSPRKKRSLRSRRKATDSDDDFEMQGSEASDEDDLEDDDLSDYEAGGRKLAKKSKKRKGHKPARRPGYGIIRSTEEMDDSEAEADALHAHRQTCEKCNDPPAHVRMTKVLKKGARAHKKNKRKGPDADLMVSSENEIEATEKFGGWVRCLRCCVSWHWKCLNGGHKKEILAAVIQREKEEKGDDYERRKALGYEETTEFVCSDCARGGLCIHCEDPIPPVNPPDAAAETEGPLEDNPTTPTAEHSDKPPSTAVLPEPASSREKPADKPMVKDAAPLLFRCFTCKRAAHYQHLPRRDETSSDALLYIAESYQDTWRCLDCTRWEYRLDRILAWRPYPADAIEPKRVPGTALDYKLALPREYLVKWDRQSFRHLEWVPHQWLLFTNQQKLRHFLVKGPRAHILPPNHPDVLEAIRNSPKAAVLKLPQSTGASNPGTSVTAPTGTEAKIGRRHNRPSDIDKGAGSEDEEELPEGEPSANIFAEYCIPKSWLVVDRILDVAFWRPKNVPKPKPKAKKGGKGKKGKRRVSSDDESEDDDVVEIDGPTVPHPELAPGEVPDPDLVETFQDREERNGEITVDDMKDVAHCFIKWRDLTHEDATWDTPPKSNDRGYEQYVAAFNDFIEAQKVDITPPSTKELKMRDERPTRDFPIIPDPGFPQGDAFKLMPFQLEGVTWLYRGWYNHQTGILADEMGLGKTVQVATFLGLLVQEQVYPALVVVPNSTISNWLREFARWAPHVRAVQYNGGAASREVIREYELYHRHTKEPKFHVLVATYETITSTTEWKSVFGGVKRWEVLIVDEGQRLKGDSSLLFRRLEELNTMHRIIMTGTPLNNNIRELFNLMHFLDPSKWYDLRNLEQEYQELDEVKLAQLHTRLKPYFLRRLKAEVMTTLPPKNEVIVPISMSPLQKEVYKGLLENNMMVLDALVGGNSRKVKNLMNLLMQLRKCMQHPYLIDPALEARDLSSEESHERLLDASGKLVFLSKMLPKLRERGHRVLIFSQFVMALDIIEDFIKGEGYKFLRLDGNVKQEQRQLDMDEFNKPGSDYFIFLLSTRAGGVGINLWSADTVIIFDPDFNPHQDLQAIARAHRMGQTKKVLVFKFMIKGAAEERIIQTGKKKLVLDHLIVQKMDSEEGEEDVASILSYGAKALFEEEGDSNDIKYSEDDVLKLIERLENEEPEPAVIATASTGQSALKFDFARIWDAGSNAMGEVVEDNAVAEANTSYWAERIARSNALKAQAQEKSGRGVRRKATQKPMVVDQEIESPEKPKPPKPKKHKKSKPTVDDDDDWTADRAMEAPSSPSSADHEMDNPMDDLMDERPEMPRKTSAMKFARPAPAPAEPRNSDFPFQAPPPLMTRPRTPPRSFEPCILCGQRHAPGDCTVVSQKRHLKKMRQEMLMADIVNKDEVIAAIDTKLAELRQEKAKRKREREQMEATVRVPERTAEASSSQAGASRSVLNPVAQSGPKTNPSVDPPAVPGSYRPPTFPKAGPAPFPMSVTSPINDAIMSPPRKKHKAQASICPICRQTPFHLLKDCPRTKTAAGIRALLQDHRDGVVTLDVSALKTIQGLADQLRQPAKPAPRPPMAQMAGSAAQSSLVGALTGQEPRQPVPRFVQRTDRPNGADLGQPIELSD